MRLTVRQLLAVQAVVPILEFGLVNEQPTGNHGTSRLTPQHHCGRPLADGGLDDEMTCRPPRRSSIWRLSYPVDWRDKNIPEVFRSIQFDSIPTFGSSRVPYDPRPSRLTAVRHGDA